MDDLARRLLAKLPLAEACLNLWAWVCSNEALGKVFDKHRGSSYESVIKFPIMVYLIANALWHHDGSGRASFEEGQTDGTLDASVQAAFGKLRRLPISLSVGFLFDCTARLAEAFPPQAELVRLPDSLNWLWPVVLDGKAIKRLAKRMKAMRGVKGGVLGGRALVAYDARRGLVVGMVAHEDGDVNDVRFVPDLLPSVRQAVPGPRLYICDRQFCNLVHLELYLAEGDHFVIRYHKNVTFTADSTRAPRSGVDGENRPYVEEWGWLGRVDHKQRRLVRRITLKRAGAESIMIITDLGVEESDADRYPAIDLLAVYLARWTIERVFQQVTEVFNLKTLIGGSPRASVFQFSFCLVMYNIIQTVRAYVAQSANKEVSEVSTEKLFDSVRKQLNAVNELLGPKATIEYSEEWKCIDAPTLRVKLTDLLANTWKTRWQKSPTQKRRPHDNKNTRGHKSAFRVLEAARKKKSRAARRKRT